MPATVSAGLPGDVQSTAPFHVRRLTTLEEFESLRQVWNELADDVPFQRWEWLRPWWQEFGRGRQLYLLEVTDESSRVRGIAPWYVENSYFKGRVVRFLGAGRVCSEYLDLLTKPADRRGVARAIADWLHRANQTPDQRWDVLEMDSVLEQRGTPQKLVEQLQMSEHRFQQMDKRHCWRVPLATDWETFLQQRPKRYRRKMRGVANALREGQATCEIARTASECQAMAGRLKTIHLARRKALRQSSCFHSCTFCDFFDAMVQNFFDSGRLYLAQLSIDGQIAASTVGLLGDRTLFVYQCGINPEMLKWQPGWMLNVFTLQHGMEVGLASVDFLRGDEHYKTHLGGEPIHSVTLQVVPDRLPSRIRNRIGWGAARLKRSAKSLLKPPADDRACCRECKQAAEDHRQGW